jgi:hypothetical protein
MKVVCASMIGFYYIDHLLIKANLNGLHDLENGLNRHILLPKCRGDRR